MECQCQQSPFINQALGHILSGNLPIVRNRKLRKLLETNLDTCVNAIKAYKTKWAKREKLDTKCLLNGNLL